MACTAVRKAKEKANPRLGKSGQSSVTARRLPFLGCIGNILSRAASTRQHMQETNWPASKMEEKETDPR